MQAKSAKLWRSSRQSTEEGILQVVAGVDLGGTAINYTLLDQKERFDRGPM
jgi:hypothetical protein